MRVKAEFCYTYTAANTGKRCESGQAHPITETGKCVITVCCLHFFGLLGLIITELPAKCCAVPSDDLTAVVQLSGGTAQHLVN